MSDRDETTGQFASAEPLYGQAGLEQAAGFVPMPVEKTEPDEELTVREAADKYTEQNSTPESDIKTHIVGADLPDNVTLTPEQAAKILSDGREADDAQAELDRTAAIQKKADEIRGVELETKAPAAEPLTPEAEVEKFLAIPHVKEAVDKLTGEAETARQTHVAAVDAATEMIRATVLSRFPVMTQIASLPQDQQSQAVASWMQQNPEAAAELAQSMGGLQQLVQQQQANEKAKSQRAQAAFREANQRFEEKIKDVPKARRAEIENEIVSVLKERSTNIENVTKFLTGIDGSSEAMELLWELGSARSQLKAIRNAPKAVATKSLPPVQRPGVAQSRSQGSDNIASIERALGSARSETQQIKLSAQLLTAKRAQAARRN